MSEEAKSYRIILTFTPEPWHLEIGGEVENLDMAMAVCQQALRSFEMQWRIAAGMQAQQEAKKAVEEHSRVAGILQKVSRIRQ